MKPSFNKILHAGFVALLVGGAIAPSNAQATCAVDQALQPTSTITPSFTRKDWDFTSHEKNVNAIPVSGCDATGTLQIVKVPQNYNPDNYQMQAFSSLDMKLFPAVCSLDTDLDKKYDSSEHFNQYVKINSYINKCIGVEVDSTNGSIINPMTTTTCEFSFLDVAKTRVLLKGENCQIAKPNGSYSVSPVYLDDCYNTDIVKSGLANIQSTIIVRQTNSEAEVLATKDVQLAINADFSNNLRTAKPTYRSSKFDILRPSDYNVDIDFAQFSITGSAKSKPVVSVRYMVRNQTDCSSDNCITASSYRAPMIVKNDLYLAKANNLSERIFLGHWFNASVLPAQWTGLDGAPDHSNALRYNWNKIQVNSSFDEAEQGDSLVLVSTLINPNRGVKSFMTAAHQYNQSLAQIKIVPGKNGRNNSDKLAAWQGLQALTFEDTIPEIDFAALMADKPVSKEDLGQNWSMRYEKYCSQLNTEDCADFLDINDPISIETEIKITKLDDSQIQVTPIATLKTSAIAPAKLTNLTKQTTLKCLRNPTLNNNINDIKIRSKK